VLLWNNICLIAGCFQQNILSNFNTAFSCKECRLTILHALADGTGSKELDKIFADRPEALTAIAEQFGADLDAIAAHYYDVLAGAAEQEALAELSEMIASPTANAISIALAALGVFIAALIVLKFITFFLDMICRLPLLDRLNTFLGLLFGAASAVVLAWVTANLAAAIVLAFQSIEPGVFNESVISGSIIVKFMREQGWILFA